MMIEGRSVWLVRYAGEVGTKDRKTRWRIIQRLKDNIEFALQKHNINAQVEAFWEHIRIYTEQDISDILKRIFGIANFSYAVHYPLPENKEDIITLGKEFFKDKISGKKYAVRVKGKKKGFSGTVIERKLGEALFPFGSGVDLTDPEITCYIEIRGDNLFLYYHKEEGLRGHPIGSQGRVILLFSGGIDSPVAGWLLWRAGLHIDFVYFDLGGEDQKRDMIKTLKFLYDQFGYGNKGNLHIIPFTPVIAEILKCRPYYQNMLLKYFFYRGAELLAKELKVSAFATGEALGQVSTQTLINISTLDRLTPLLVIRPLFVMEKEEIKRLSQQIGTYELAYTGKEYCALATKQVGTAIPYEDLIKEALRCNTEPFIEALANRETISLDQLEDVLKTLESQETHLSIPKDAEIIDLRTPSEFERWHIPGSKNIPFTEAWTQFPLWDKGKKYFLVCSEGMASALLAHHMKQEGFDVDHLEGGIQALIQKEHEQQA